MSSLGGGGECQFSNLSWEKSANPTKNTEFFISFLHLENVFFGQIKQQTISK